MQTLIDMSIIIEYDRYNNDNINNFSASNNYGNEMHPRHLFEIVFCDVKIKYFETISTFKCLFNLFNKDRPANKEAFGHVFTNLSFLGKDTLYQ